MADAPPSSLPPRRAALALLNAVTGEGRLLSDLLAAPSFARLSAPDRARAQRLTLAALRGAGRADALIAPHLKHAPPLAVRNALRLGLSELATGQAAHGVVNDCVSLMAEGKRTAGLKGLVNALLRRLGPGLPDLWPTLPVPRLPDWLRAPLLQAWGAPALAAMEAAHLAGAPLDLTARGDAAALATLTGGRLLPTGSVRLDDPGQVSTLPGHDDGLWWVQDAAAALPARVLAPARGEDVLDLCAAPGGKTMQLAAMGARVTAVDASGARLARLSVNLARTGLKAEVVESDALAFARPGWSAILLDAPCSATGTIRRHPDLPFAKDGAGISDLIALQARLIDHALSLLAPGGRLVFCTCSVIPDEGEVQVEDALSRHPGLTVDRAALALPGLPAGLITPEGVLRTLPGQAPALLAETGGWDGFAIACLRKPG
jgi:16S rRNA (cytosine967-C5)-methyltransferase